VRIIHLGERPKVEKDVHRIGGGDAVAFSPDAKRIATGGPLARVFVIDTATGKQVRVFGEATDELNVTSLAFSPDGKTVIAGHEEGVIRAWSLEAKEPLLWESRPFRSRVSCMAFAPGGKELVAGSGEGNVRVLHAGSGKDTGVAYHPHRRAVWRLAVSPDGRWIANTSFDRHLHVWDVEKRKTHAYVKTGFEAAAVAFRDGHVLAAEGAALKSLSIKDKTLRDER
jgi:WD40 repeat protein